MTDSNGFLKRSERGRFAKGTPSGPGRRKGTPNRTTTDLRTIRDAIAASWDRNGGDALLDRLAHEDYKAFLEFVGRQVPRAIELRDDKATAPIVVNMICETPPPPVALPIDTPTLPQLPSE